MGSWDEVSDEELLVATAERAEAFGVFYRRHVAWMLAFCVRRTGDAEQAADLTAEVFSAALIASGRFRPGRAAARTWLFAIALHKLASYERRGRVERRARARLKIGRYELSVQDHAELSALVNGRVEGELAVELLARLPADQREALNARVIDGRSYPELANALHCSEATVRKRVSRGLASLRAQLEEG